MGHSFISLLMISVLQLVYLLGVFVAVGFLLGFLERLSTTYLVRAFGRKGILFTSWIGTPIHEIGHLIMAILFRHKILKVKLWQWNDPNGVLGYVSHSYNPKSIYQRAGSFFIGIAPVFSGITALIISMYWLVPQSYQVFHFYLETQVQAGQINTNTIETMLIASFTLCKSLFSFSSFLTPSFWLFLVLAISISSHIALSRADMKESYHGLMMIFGLLVLWNIVAGYIGIDSQEMIVAISTYNAYVLAFSSIAIIFSSITLGVSYLLYKSKKR